MASGGHKAIDISARLHGASVHLTRGRRVHTSCSRELQPHTVFPSHRKDGSCPSDAQPGCRFFQVLRGRCLQGPGRAPCQLRQQAPRGDGHRFVSAKGRVDRGRGELVEEEGLGLIMTCARWRALVLPPAQFSCELEHAKKDCASGSGGAVKWAKRRSEMGRVGMGAWAARTDPPTLLSHSCIRRNGGTVQQMASRSS